MKIVIVHGQFGGLPRSVGAEEAEYLTATHAETYMVDGGKRAEPLGQPLYHDGAGVCRDGADGIFPIIFHFCHRLAKG